SAWAPHSVTTSLRPSPVSIWDEHPHIGACMMGCRGDGTPSQSGNPRGLYEGQRWGARLRRHESRSVDTQLPPDPDGLDREASSVEQEEAPGAEAPKRTTDVLFETIERVQGERISIGELIDGLGERAYGIMMLLFALPTILPAPPGMSAITGMPI